MSKYKLSEKVIINNRITSYTIGTIEEIMPTKPYHGYFYWVSTTKGTPTYGYYEDDIIPHNEISKLLYL